MNHSLKETLHQKNKYIFWYKFKVIVLLETFIKKLYAAVIIIDK
jgi:hypothetical protein